MSKKKIKVIIIGLGHRGRVVYGDYIVKHKELFDVVGICDPVQEKIDFFQNDWEKPIEHIANNVEYFYNKDKLADIAIIATPDNEHFQPAKEFMLKGYDVLLEKPVTKHASELEELIEIQKTNKNEIFIAHVLRYTNFYQTLKEIISNEKVGKIVGVDHVENIGNYHMAHSFVRGNWNNESESSPIVLAKTCHDLDLLHFLTEQKCNKVYSYGNLNFFNKQNKYLNSADRCNDCELQKDCTYNSEYIYIDKGLNRWPSNTISASQEAGDVRNIVNNSNYGKCVFECNNDVCDHQVGILQLENNINATFTLTAFTHHQYRSTKFYCTKASIEANTMDNTIKIIYFGKTRYDKTETIIVEPEIADSGHGGGDDGIMDSIVNYYFNKGQSITTLENSLESHIVALALEKSRLNKETIEIQRDTNGKFKIK